MLQDRVHGLRGQQLLGLASGRHVRALPVQLARGTILQGQDRLLSWTLNLKLEPLNLNPKPYAQPLNPKP